MGCIETLCAEIEDAPNVERVHANLYNAGLSLLQRDLHSSAQRLLTVGLRRMRKCASESNLLCNCASALMDASLTRTCDASDTDVLEMTSSVAPAAADVTIEVRKQFVKRYVKFVASKELRAPHLFDFCAVGLPTSLLGVSEARAWEECSQLASSSHIAERRRDLAEVAADHARKESGEYAQTQEALALSLQAGTLEHEEEEALRLSHLACEKIAQLHSKGAHSDTCVKSMQIL